MIRNYFLIAFRNLWRNKVFSAINIVGLTLGTTGSFLIFLWISYATSFDQFHSKKDRIYQVFSNHHSPDGKIETWQNTPYPIMDKLKEIPEIEKSVITTNRNTYIGINKNMYNESSIYVSPDFLHIFDFPLLAGNRETALKEPYYVVISKKVALKLFGNETKDFSKLLGKLVMIDKTNAYHISAIVDDMPANSTIKFDILLPFENFLINEPYVKDVANQWGNFNYSIFILKNEKSILSSINQKIEPIVQKNHPYLINNKEFKVSLMLFPFADINLHSKFENGKSVGGLIDIVNILTIGGVFLLLLTCFNFINLTISQTNLKFKEIGLNKVLGATKWQVFLRFIIEIATVITISFVISGLIILFSWNILKDILNIELGLFFQIKHFLWLGLVVYVITILLSSVYPALVLASFKPISLFSKNTNKALNLSILQKILVLLQLTIGSVFLISSLLIFLQTKYMLEKDLGQQTMHVFYAWLTDNQREHKDAYSTEISKIKGVEKVCFSNLQPLGIYNHTGDVEWKTKGKIGGSYHILQTDENFLPTMQLTLLKGRNFDKNLKSDTANFIINETMAKILGEKTALNQEITVWEKKGKIIGIVKDFHFAHQRFKIDPLIIKYQKRWFNLVLVKTSESNQKQVLQLFESTYKKFSNGEPFYIKWLDDELKDMYKTDYNLSILAVLVAFLAVVTSVIGLLGITIFSVQNRTKEIGIRKVMGASVWKINLLLSKDFIQLGVISTVISWVIAYYFIEQWLNNYAYKIDLVSYLWIFVLSSAMSLLISVFIILLKTFKTAMSNPVESLRNE